MCLFSQHVESVRSTSIFARFVSPGRQALIYSMDIESRQDVAMVLPLPVLPGTGDDAVEFVNLAGNARFFEDLALAFPPIPVPDDSGFDAMDLDLALDPTPVVVHDVGDFEASYVPTLGDFERLDARFRLDPRVWDGLPIYQDHGFAVFKLKATLGRGVSKRTRREKTIHPMALTFPTRRPDALYFPTVHIHDGQLHEVADFDHALYCQRVGAPEALAGTPPSTWDPSKGRFAHFLDVSLTKGLCDGNARGWRAILRGSRPNTDTWV